MSLTGKMTHFCTAVKYRPNCNSSCFFCPSLDELQKFVRATVQGLGQPVAKGNHRGLVEVMSHLLAVRDRQAATDEMFEPFRDTITLLEQYGVTVPDQVYFQLEVRNVMDDPYFQTRSYDKNYNQFTKYFCGIQPLRNKSNSRNRNFQRNGVGPKNWP